jgi:hypothetical protein
MLGGQYRLGAKIALGGISTVDRGLDLSLFAVDGSHCRIIWRNRDGRAGQQVGGSPVVTTSAAILQLRLEDEGCAADAKPTRVA